MLQILAIIASSVAMALSLAHALEYPGKLKLDRDTYLAMQRIYYPGFTVGGASEPIAIILAFIVLAKSPAGAPFWLTLAALVALVAMQTVFWLVTQPVNKVWLAGASLSGAGAAFFGHTRKAMEDWTVLRDRWEYSHIARAILSAAAFVLLLVSATLYPLSATRPS